jgi:sterol desaturase/sphingolipid hydroxylase (fatty acid hydroxylase superfamily)
MNDALQALYGVIYYVVFNLTKAVTAVIQRDSYFYWPFILSTIAIAAFAVRYTANAGSGPGKPSWRQLFRQYCGAHHWWHRSARADYRLYFANALVLPLVLAPLLFTDAQVMGLIDAALGREAGAAAHTAAAPTAWQQLSYTLIFFVAYDYGRFAAHALLHDVPLLWEFHKVHHAAEVLTPVTAARAHPVDLLVMAWIPALTTGIATWLFNRVAAQPVTAYTFLGLNVLIWAFNLIDNLRHSNVWLSYGPNVGKWLISPAHHQLHHSCEARHLGCNRGFELAIWDRLHGTLVVPSSAPETFRMGLGDGTEAQWQSVWRMYIEPFKGCVRTASDRLRRLIREQKA